MYVHCVYTYFTTTTTKITFHTNIRICNMTTDMLRKTRDTLKELINLQKQKTVHAFLTLHTRV